ncbi:AraC family transcriptional regulator [Reichenbachiella agarivorans]|uniref:AraC family transcriptional regulator n=1 Tax=Reichenbachiella agarivorans TaxID=2979464 RepID=A0ABY6CNI6_9BACT|nr:AraC family transcriptional regulator [Reichenbachiella agarivorans]UXP32052.1 AraC family transcriptional regulator [Reichenbachiella agarivorans]
MKQTTITIYESNHWVGNEYDRFSSRFEWLGTDHAILTADVVLVHYASWDEFNHKYPRWFVLEETTVFVLSDELDIELQVELLQQGIIDVVPEQISPELLHAKYQSAMRQRQLSFLGVEDAADLATSWLDRVTAIIEQNIANTEFNVQSLVRGSGMSRSVLYCKLKELTGLSTSEFIRIIRLRHAVAMLRSGQCSVKEVRFRAGFNSASYFTRCFKKIYGYLPSEYLKSINTTAAIRISSEFKGNPTKNRHYINA